LGYLQHASKFHETVSACTGACDRTGFTIDKGVIHPIWVPSTRSPTGFWESRERTFFESKDGQTLMQTTSIAHLGGATLDNEENYLIKKLFTGGQGMVCLGNQARI
jgi:hypothetical protein